MLNSKTLRLLMLSWILTVFMSILSVNAMQIERKFPEDIKRGKLTTTALAQLVIDGKLRVDSPALRIFNEDNSISTIASVDVRNIVINYVENEIGEIVRIWILSAEEARQPLPKKN
jgi:hypothetical protein